jgi:hypothetical protein
MAKSFTAAQLTEAEGFATMAAGEVLDARGLTGTRRRFSRNGRARKKLAEKFYADYVAGGGDAADWQSFLDWLLEHADEIIAFVSKIILLFAI